MSLPPFERAAIEFYHSRQAWDAASVEILQTMLHRWSLTSGTIFRGGYSATVMAVTDADGVPAVLKVAFPHPEALAEAVALEAFPVGTAPRILRLDPWSWTMLLERVLPGTSLAEHPASVDETIVAGATLLARLQESALPEGIPTLAHTVSGFVAGVQSHSADVRQLGAGKLVADALDDAANLLASDARPPVLIHGDFNPGNILRSHDGWIAIDPKPMSGDGAWDLWPLVSQLGSVGRHGPTAIELRRRMELATRVAGLDTARSIRWARFRAALTICWYLGERDTRRAEAEISSLESWTSAVRSLSCDGQRSDSL